MPLVNKRVRLLGRDPVPEFARRACLHWFGFADLIGPLFPAQWTIYNIAALAFYPRRGAIGQVTDPPLSLSYWSHTSTVGVDFQYGQDWLQIPQDAEWFSVAWLKPPLEFIESAQGPYPEDFFRLKFGLAI